MKKPSNHRRRRTPCLGEVFPFALPGHVRVSELLGIPEAAPLLAAAAGESHVRLPRTRWALKPCSPPTEGELAAYILKRHMPEDTQRCEQADVQELAAIAERALGLLAAKARNGDGRALWEFASAAWRATEGLSQMTRRNPSALAPFAATVNRWPLMRSTAPLCSDSDDTLRAIGLGASLPICLDQHSKWKPDFASLCAFALFKHLEDIREVNPIVELPGQDVSAKEWLPEFNRESAPNWWAVAWQCLLASYPRPESVAELGRIVTSPSKRKSPGRIRQAIHDTLRRRFLAIAKL